MKILILLSFFILSSCNPIKDNGNNPDPLPPGAGGSTLKVASFNIQIFGLSKMSKPAVVDVLIKTVSRYDLVLIQEIRDSGGSAIVDFMNQLNSYSGNQYNYIIGSRLGRSSSTEQYAYIYKKNVVSVVHSYEFNDSSDYFEREPLIGLFEFISTGDQFTVIGIHVKPSDVVNELNRLDDVYHSVEDYYNVNKSIIMGDFNADCSYLTDSAESSLQLKTDYQFNWNIDKSVDTTVGASNCAYDRIITTGSISNHVSGVEIFNFPQAYGLSSTAAAEVSDHYPVSITISF